MVASRDQTRRSYPRPLSVLIWANFQPSPYGLHCSPRSRLDRLCPGDEFSARQSTRALSWPIYMLDAAIKPDACGIIGKYKAANSCTTGLRHVSKSDFSNPHSSYRAYRCAVDSGTSFHMRTQSHIIDTKAVKAVMAQLPDHWVVRELSERDYGIDLLVEIFAPGLKDAMGKMPSSPPVPFSTSRLRALKSHSSLSARARSTTHSKRNRSLTWKNSAHHFSCFA